MEEQFTRASDSEILAVLNAGVDALCDDRVRLPDDTQQLELLKGLVRLGGRVTALQQQLAATAEQSQSAWAVCGTSVGTWMAGRLNLTRREAGQLVKAGQELQRFPIIAEAACAGTVLPPQAGAITSVLADLPRDFPDTAVREAQELMVGFAGDHNSVELKHLSAHLLEVVSPETADEIEAKRLERQEQQAQAHRFLEFTPDGHGSVLIRGSLPTAQAETLIQIVEAYAAMQKRGLEAADPWSRRVTATTRRADGLMAMVAAHSQQSLAPAHGGDRPRIVITLSYDKLAKHCTDHHLGAHLTRSGDPLPAGIVRQLLCDSDILPVVMGGPSEPLDVGRTQRLVTPPIRAALEVRDGGCVFPGCDRPPETCEAHHLIPWWAGGETALSNLALLCPHHHGIVEPGHDPDHDRWTAHLGDDGITRIVPPARVDPQQRPRVHARFHTRR